MYATIMPPLNDLLKALDDGRDAAPAMGALQAALDALPAPFTSHVPKPFAATILVSAAGSPVPGTLALATKRGLLPTPGDFHPATSHSALRALHPAQADAFAAFIAADMDIVATNPTSTHAWTWSAWAITDPQLHHVCAAFGLDHALPIPIGATAPFAVRPRPSDAIPMAAHALKAYAAEGVTA